MTLNRHQLTADGVPFEVTLPGEGTREDAMRELAAALDENPELLDAKAKRLGLTEEDRKALRGETGANAPELSTGEEVLVGAGERFTRMGRGFKQLMLGLSLHTARKTGDERMIAKTGAQLDELNRRIKNDKELFQVIDEGIGAEDFGALLAELPAYLVGVSLAPAGAGAATVAGAVGGGAAAGGLLGALDTVNEGGPSRGVQAATGAIGGALGGTLGNVGGIAARTAIQAPKELAKSFASTGLDVLFTGGAVSGGRVAVNVMRNGLKVAGLPATSLKKGILELLTQTRSSHTDVLQAFLRGLGKTKLPDAFPILTAAGTAGSSQTRSALATRAATLLGIETIEGQQEQ